MLRKLFEVKKDRQEINLSNPKEIIPGEGARQQLGWRNRYTSEEVREIIERYGAAVKNPLIRTDYYFQNYDWFASILKMYEVSDVIIRIATSIEKETDAILKNMELLDLEVTPEEDFLSFHPHYISTSEWNISVTKEDDGWRTSLFNDTHERYIYPRDLNEVDREWLTSFLVQLDEEYQGLRNEILAWYHDSRSRDLIKELNKLF